MKPRPFELYPDLATFTTVDTNALLLLIAVGTFVIVGFTTLAFILFSRFLKAQKEEGERFRAARSPPPEDGE